MASRNPFHSLKLKVAQYLARRRPREEIAENSIGPSWRIQVASTTSLIPCKVCHCLQIGEDEDLSESLGSLFESAQEGCTVCSLLGTGVCLFVKDAKTSYERVRISRYPYANGMSLLLSLTGRMFSEPVELWKITFSFPEGITVDFLGYVFAVLPSYLNEMNDGQANQ